MKKMTRILAVLLALALALSVAACGNAQESNDTPETTVAPVANAAGKLTVAFGALVEITYDETGKLLKLEGTNDTGKTIVAACTGFENRDVVHCVRALLRYASDNQLLSGVKTMCVYINKDSAVPSEEFLPTIIQDTQYLADEECTGVRMVGVGPEDLDSQGFIGLERAQHLAMLFLGATMTADLSGDEEIASNNTYTFDYEGAACVVDAATGLVTAVE